MYVCCFTSSDILAMWAFHECNRRLQQQHRITYALNALGSRFTCARSQHSQVFMQISTRIYYTLSSLLSTGKLLHIIFIRTDISFVECTFSEWLLFYFQALNMLVFCVHQYPQSILSCLKTKPVTFTSLHPSLCWFVHILFVFVVNLVASDHGQISKKHSNNNPELLLQFQRTKTARKIYDNYIEELIPISSDI